MNWMQKGKWGTFFKSVIWTVLISFTVETFGFHSAAYAQTYLQSLPVPGTAVNLSSAYAPIMMKGIKTYPDNPFRFDFFIDPGQESLDKKEVGTESNKLIKYFLASLTVPEDQLWVNLSPYEKDRIMPAGFGVTEMGRDLLAQDYFLKQISASLLDPTTPHGEEFWKKIYAKIRELGGDAGAVNTFNKVWIVPQTADVYTKDGSAFVIDSHLKVMLEEDYLSLQQTGAMASAMPVQRNQYSSVIREVIVPALEKEVNEGENFAMLRQIYHSMILATWYKRHLRESIFSKVYVGQNKVGGVDVDDKDIKEKIYQQYLSAFQKGVFNFIREDYDAASDETIPRKYFAGGVDLNFTSFGAVGSSAIFRETSDPLSLRKLQLGATAFLGDLYYRVTSLVVSSDVNWYDSLKRDVPAQIAASAVSSPISNSAPVASGIFSKTGIRFAKGIALSTIVLLSSLGFATQAQGAQFNFDDSRGVIVQVERGDTMGSIVKTLQAQKKFNSEITDANLWGQGGAVEKVANAINLTNPNEIKAGDVYVVPATFLAQINTPAPALAAAEPVIEKVEITGKRLAPVEVRAPAPFASEGSRLPISVALTNPPDDVESSVGPIPPTTISIDPTIPLTATGLLLAALAWMGRQNLMERTAKVFDFPSKRATTRSTAPQPAPLRPAPVPSPAPAPAAVVIKPEEMKTRAALLLAERMRSLSLPYLYAEDMMKGIAHDRTTSLLDSFQTVLRQDAELWASLTPQEKETQLAEASGLFIESLTLWMASAGRMILKRDDLDALITAKADELVAQWVFSGKAQFSDEAALDDFIHAELNPMISARIRDFEAAIKSLDSDLIASEILSPLAYANRLKQTAPRELVDRITNEIYIDLAAALKIKKEDVKAEASILPIHRETVTVENIKTVILQSPVVRSMVARLHEQARVMSSELEPKLVEAFMGRKWSVRNEGLPQESASDWASNTAGSISIRQEYAAGIVAQYFTPVVTRYLDAGFDQRFAGGEIADLINSFAESLANKYAGKPISAIELADINAFIKGELERAIEQRLDAAEDLMRRQVWSEEDEDIYQSAIDKSMSREGAIANGSGILLALTAAKAADEIALILREDHDLNVVPVLVRAMGQKLTEEETGLAVAPPAAPANNQATANAEPRAPPSNYALVDAAVLTTTAAGMIAFGQTDLVGVVTTLASPFLFRAGLTSSYWFHEFSHVVAGGRNAWTKENLLGNISILEWRQMLSPLFGKVATDLKVKVKNSPIHAWINRLAGLGTSAAIFLGGGALLLDLWRSGRHGEVFAALPLLYGPLAVLLGSIKTDLIKPLKGLANDCEFECGDAIAVGEFGTDEMREIFHDVGDVTGYRGHQAGGFKVQTKDSKGNTFWIGDRTVNAKRGDLAETLDTKLRNQILLAKARGLKVSEDYNVLIGHYRYGTSSAPKKTETHPHQWMPDRKVKLWSIDASGKLVENDRILGMTIVHNGDFDDWRFNNKYQSNGDIAVWLERVLFTPNTTSGDSPKIAGMMDYLRTQGMWDAAARFAFYEEADDTFGESLSAQNIEQFATRFREVFNREGQKLVRAGDSSLADLWSSDRARDKVNLVGAMVINLKGMDIVQDWDKQKRLRFVEAALKAFLLNDEYEAAKIFIDRAKGSFGLGIGSTLKPGGVILVADGQPLALGMDADHKKLLAVSEPSALKIKLRNDKRLSHRLTLRQNIGRGEIVNISGPGNFVIYSRDKKKELTPEEIDSRLVPLQNNPYISELPTLVSDDPVGDDIRETAKVMADIKKHWDDPNSPNRQTQRNILGALLQKKIEKQIRETSKAYLTTQAQMREDADAMSFDVRRHLVGALQKKIDSTKDWESELQLRNGATRLSLLLEGAISAVWDKGQVEQLIREQAANITGGLLRGEIDSSGSRIVIKDFIKNVLESAIEDEHERVRGEIEHIMSNWREAIAQDLILQVKRSLKRVQAEGDTDLASLGKMPFESLEDLWMELGVTPGIQGGKKAFDFVVTGFEISQWMSEQFVNSLQQIFPELRIHAESSNKVLEDPIAAGIDDHTIVLAVSQSGQTFSTLNAAIMLEQLSPGRVYALTGEWDTLMGQAVGQDFMPDSPFAGRIISNLTGFRPSEAVSLTGTATHVTLTELMLRLTEDFDELMPHEKPFGLALTSDGIQKLKEKRDVSINEVAQIIGVDQKGNEIASSENKILNVQAKKWARHVLDSPFSMIATKVHLIVAVIGGGLLFPWLAGFLPVAAAGFVAFGASVAQYFFFEFFQYTVTVALRKFQGRETLARTGKRTIVIGERSYIHQSLETFVSKLNSLSKSATSIDVHGANPGDHMVARFGHRVVRGSLIWLGVTDGRLGGKLAEWQSSIAMTGKQAKGVRNFGVGAEVIAVGRERSFNKNASDVDITIKGDVEDIPSELAMLYEDRYDSLARLVSGQYFFYRMMRIVSTLDLSPGWRKFWPWAWKMNRTQSGPRIATTASPRSVPDYTRFIQKRPLVLPLGMHSRTEEAAAAQEVDRASSAASVNSLDEVGGIDLNPRTLKLNMTGQQPLPTPQAPSFILDPKMINALPTDHFVPLIIEVVPIPTAEMFLGMSQPAAGLATASR